MYTVCIIIIILYGKSVVRKHVHVHMFNSCTCIHVYSIICNYQWILLTFHPNRRQKYPVKFTTILTPTSSLVVSISVATDWIFILRYHSNQIVRIIKLQVLISNVVS